MNTVHVYMGRIIRNCLVMCAAISGVFILLNRMDWLGGYCLGVGISIVNFYIMALDTEKAIVRRSRNGRSFLIIRFFLRYSMIALAMYVTFLHGLAIVAFMAGVLAIQTVLLIEYTLWPRLVQ